jgi:hypothetical protein
MPAAVNLKDIVDELEMPLDDHPSFVDLDAGEEVSASQDLLHDAEDAARTRNSIPALPANWRTRSMAPARFACLRARFAG